MNATIDIRKREIYLRLSSQHPDKDLLPALPRLLSESEIVTLRYSYNDHRGVATLEMTVNNDVLPFELQEILLDVYANSENHPRFYLTDSQQIDLKECLFSLEKNQPRFHLIQVESHSLRLLYAILHFLVLCKRGIHLDQLGLQALQELLHLLRQSRAFGRLGKQKP